MVESQEEKEIISLDAALRMEIFISQALIELLVAKGIFTHDELMEKIKEIRLNSKIELEKSK